MARKLALAALLLLAGCNWYYDKVPSPDDLMKAIPWFDHMVKSRAVHPYGRADLPRNTVPGTVPITGGEANWSAEFLSGNPATARNVEGYSWTCFAMMLFVSSTNHCTSFGDSLVIIW